MFLLVLAHPGCPGQDPESRKMVCVRACVRACSKGMCSKQCSCIRGPALWMNKGWVIG